MLRAAASASRGELLLGGDLAHISAITLRHQKQRQVTWSRVAARCTASSPKISQVSRPASIATSISSPEIQRATATVEVWAIRSNASWVIGSSSRSNRTVRATVASQTSSTRAFSAAPISSSSGPPPPSSRTGGVGDTPGGLEDSRGSTPLHRLCARGIFSQHVGGSREANQSV